MTETVIRFVRNPDYIFRKVVDELVLVPIHQEVADMESIYTLNEVGAFIWEQLAQPASLKDLGSLVLEEFEAEDGVVVADLEKFMDELSEFGAVSRSD